MTVSGTPLTSTTWPTGSTPLNSSEAVSTPSTATAVCSATSWLSIKRPWVTVRSRTVAQVGVVPLTVVVQVLELTASVSPSAEDLTGATALMSGATVAGAERAGIGFGEGGRRAEPLAESAR